MIENTFLFQLRIPLIKKMLFIFKVIGFFLEFHKLMSNYIDVILIYQFISISTCAKDYIYIAGMFFTLVLSYLRFRRLERKIFRRHLTNSWRYWLGVQLFIFFALMLYRNVLTKVSIHQAQSDYPNCSHFYL